MKPKDWKGIAELIGIAAIVASLLFVGLQMKQSHEIALAAQYQARAEAVMNLQATAMEVDYIPPVGNFRNLTSDLVTAKDTNLMLWLWIAFDNHFYQYKAGYLDEEFWQAQLTSIKELHAWCDGRFVYDWRKSGLRAEFVSMVESFEDPCSESKRD
jgi:hypothetical protein